MWLYEIRDTIFNHLIVWMMKHCHCWAGVFYTACSRYYPNSVRGMFNSWNEYMEEKGE
jgi:hypothetical protein